MAQGYNSPGYMIAEQLQEILARRRAEARQDMLDKLEQDKFAHGVEMDRDTQATNRLYREAQAKQWEAEAQDRTAQAQARLAGQLSMGQPITRATAQRLDPAMVVPGVDPEQAATTGPTGFSVQPSTQIMAMKGPNGEDLTSFDPERDATGVSEILSNAPKVTPDTFYGLPKEREDRDKKRMMGELISSGQLSPEVAQSLMISMLTGKEFSIADLSGAAGKTTPDILEYEYYKKSVPPGQKVMSPLEYAKMMANLKTPRPPQYSPNYQPLPEVNPLTGVQTGRYFSFDTRTNTMVPVKIPGQAPQDKIPLGTAPEATKAPPQGRSQEIPTDMIKQYEKAVKDAAKSTTLLGGVNQEAVANRERYASELIRRYPVSENAKSVVAEIWTNPKERNLPIAAILKLYQGADGTPITPDEAREITSLLTLLRGQ